MGSRVQRVWKSIGWFEQIYMYIGSYATGLVDTISGSSLGSAVEVSSYDTVALRDVRASTVQHPNFLRPKSYSSAAKYVINLFMR